MSAPGALGSVLDAGGADLSAGLEAAEERLGALVGAQGPALSAHASDTLAAGGKRLRPMLVFLCGGGASEALIGAAAAVELLHMATLVHDDVLDRASLRRGRPTVFAQAGRATATATGDVLFSRAFAELAATGSADAVRALSHASSRLAHGELMQRDDAYDASVTRERYRDRCAAKTGSLFAAACRMGALLGGAAPDAEALARFGGEVGIAFQMLDDVLDVSGPQERTGKRRGTDLLDGTVTLPLIIGREHDRRLAELDPASLAGDPEAAEQACARIVATGALEQAREEALEHVEHAKQALAGLDLPKQRADALALVAEGVVERYA